MPIKKILVIDDSATDQQYLRELLTGKGFQVVAASGGEEGVSKANS